MTERLPEPAAPRSMNQPVEPSRELTRKNLTLALALLAVSLVIAAGAVAVALIYLHYD